jgi:hypothetical protein
MKAKQPSILMYGHDEHLLETRQWVLESRGYRVVTMVHPSGFKVIPLMPPIRLLLLCHSLSPGECDAAIALASARWGGIKSLVLDADGTRAPSGILGQLLHTMEGPAKLISAVSKIVGRGLETTGSADA